LKKKKKKERKKGSPKIHVYSMGPEGSFFLEPKKSEEKLE
jgi:hypothetical protein